MSQILIDWLMKNEGFETSPKKQQVMMIDGIPKGHCRNLWFPDVSGFDCPLKQWVEHLNDHGWKNQATLLKCDQLYPLALEMDPPIISGGNQTWHWAIPCFNGGFWLGKSSISGWWDFPAIFDYWRVSRGFWQMSGASAVAAVWTSLQRKRCCLAKWRGG